MILCISVGNVVKFVDYLEKNNRARFVSSINRVRIISRLSGGGDETGISLLADVSAPLRGDLGDISVKYGRIFILSIFINHDSRNSILFWWISLSG